MKRYNSNKRHNKNRKSGRKTEAEHRDKRQEEYNVE